MYNDEDRKWLYNKMQSAGVNTGSFDDFSKSLDNDEDRAWYYKKSQALGLDVGSSKDFDSMMMRTAAANAAERPAGDAAGTVGGPAGEAAGTVNGGVQTYTMEELDRDNTAGSAGGNAIPAEETGRGTAAAVQQHTNPMGESETRDGIARQQTKDGETRGNGPETKARGGQQMINTMPVGMAGVPLGNMLTPQTEEAIKERDEEAEYRRQQKEAFEQNGGRERLDALEQQANEALDQSRGVQIGRLMQRGAQLMPGALGKGLAWGAGKFMEFLGASLDEKAADAMTAKRMVDETKAMLDEAGHADNGWVDRQLGGVWRGMTHTLLDVNTWDFGLRDMANSFNVAGVAQKADKGEQLTPSEQMLMDAMMLNSVVQQGYQDDISMGYQAGEVAGYSAGFAASLAANPASGIGQGLQAGAKATTQAAMREMVKRYGINGARRFMMAAKPFGVIGEKAGSIVARGAGDLAEAAVATGTVQLPRWMQNFGERVAGQTQAYYDENGQLQYAGQEGAEKDVLDALAKSFGSTYIENASEMVGEWLPFGKIDDLAQPIAKDAERGIMRFGRKEGKNGVEKLTLHPEDFTPGQWSQAVRALRQRAHFGGLASEYLEEVIGNVANAMTVGDNNFNHWSKTVGACTSLEAEGVVTVHSKSVCIAQAFKESDCNTLTVIEVMSNFVCFMPLCINNFFKT